MNYKLSSNIVENIKMIAQKYPVSKIIFFGSRARGDNRNNSDIDLAVYALPEFHNEGRITSDIDDIDTLLKFDIVFINSNTDKRLVDNINREGVVIYERL